MLNNDLQQNKSNYSILHKKLYSRFLDDLDNEVVARIMADPNCSEAQALNKRVNEAVIIAQNLITEH